MGHLLQERAGLADRACGLLQARDAAPERHAAHAAFEAGLIGRARCVRGPRPLLQLPQHEVQLVEVGELLDALLQQPPLLCPIRTAPLKKEVPRPTTTTSSELLHTDMGVLVRQTVTTWPPEGCRHHMAVSKACAVHCKLKEEAVGGYWQLA